MTSPQPKDDPVRLQNLSRVPYNRIVKNDLNGDSDQHGLIVASERKKLSDATLNEHEAKILKRQVDIAEANVGLFSLYRYASKMDLFVIFISSLASVVSGATTPLMILVFGNLQGQFETLFQGNVDKSAFERQVADLVLYFVYIAIGSFVATYVSTVGFIYTGERISTKIREKYLEALLRQNIGFFDHLGAGEVTTRITNDANLIQEGISEKVGLTMAGIATFVAAFVIGFIQYWKLALILMSGLVALVVVMIGSSILVAKYSKQAIEAHGVGGSLAEEVLGSVRNAVAFGTQDRLVNQYDSHLKKAGLFDFRSKAAMSLMMAGLMLVVNMTYGLAFWQGGQYVIYEGLESKKVLITTMTIILGSFSFGNIAPNIQALSTGMAAASKIYSAIDRSSPLDPFKMSGKSLDSFEGTIVLDRVKHVYPSRPDVTVMDDFSLSIPSGKTTALVGASGSGKSTIVGLIERFYEPVQGTIYLDGHDISTLNLQWLRQQIAMVGQEPILFATTIAQNIKHGLIGTHYWKEDTEAQQALIVEAAKLANAHEFIIHLPEGYETNVGRAGFLMSGGQKQRIAIARAIVSKPKILLLDEATSALDTKSEVVVQQALDAAAAGRTTITIAHRLSTVRKADNIVVMEHGRLVEQGTHSELLKLEGAYSNLVAAQKLWAQEGPGEGKSPDSESDTDDSTQVVLQGPRVGLETSTERKLEKTQSLALVPAQPDAILQKHSAWALTKLIASFNKQDMALMVIGTIFSVISGGGIPVQCVILAKSIATLSTPLTSSNRDQVKHEADFWAAMYVMLAGAMLVSYSAHGILYAKCSEQLVRRARCSVFRSMLRQDIAFFDESKNSSGALTAFLSTKVADLAGLSGVTLGTILSVLTTLIAGIVVGVSIGWKLGLVCTSTTPILILCGYFRLRLLSQLERHSREAHRDSASYAAEAVSTIRTIASLTREADVVETYRGSLNVQRRANVRSMAKISLLFSVSEAMTFLIFALCFWYGGRLLVAGEYSLFQFFVCFATVIFSAQSAGAFFSFAANISKAYIAAEEIITLLDCKPKIDTWSTAGQEIHTAQGHVQFEDVHFRYPTRPDQMILRGLTVDIRPGQYVAFVGSSGCGKTTTISLLERFYDPTRGKILIDGVNISLLNINNWRSLVALVSQEPTLYQGTIKENILLGSNEDISDDQLEQACREASIHDFILSLPDGFNTTVGSKGTLLSGGQKQRVAIARAIIRNPRVLLLDEATSALDTESEHIVQAALDQAAKGRTTIVIAHRLSTIQKADKIIVLEQGLVVEEGTHAQLLQKNGYYAELVNLQTLQHN